MTVSLVQSVEPWRWILRMEGSDLGRIGILAGLTIAVGYGMVHLRYEAMKLWATKVIAGENHGDDTPLAHIV